jgi:hypothetical protein
MKPRWFLTWIYDESVRTKDDSLAAWVNRQYPEYNGVSSVRKGIEVFLWLTADSSLLPVVDTTLIDPNAEIKNEIVF